MQRRNFLKLSATTTAAILLSRLTYATSAQARVMHMPDEVWAQSGDEWLRLKPASGSVFTYKDIEVRVKAEGNAKGVYATSPTQPLNAIRLKWKHDIPQTAKFLGDHWERSYGDLRWKTDRVGVKNPWYVIIYDSRQTACFGVKTGANSICWWSLGDDSLQLTLDTHSGGNGVLLGGRTLHAADIVTTGGKEGENPFHTDHQFCGIMCEKPRLPKQPIYGINDWYFAYGNNSFDLIKKNYRYDGRTGHRYQKQTFLGN